MAARTVGPFDLEAYTAGTEAIALVGETHGGLPPLGSWADLPYWSCRLRGNVRSGEKRTEAQEAP